MVSSEEKLIQRNWAKMGDQMEHSRELQTKNEGKSRQRNVETMDGLQMDPDELGQMVVETAVVNRSERIVGGQTR